MPSDRLYRRGVIWYVWGYDSAGARWHESTQQTDRRAAALVARDIARRRASPGDAARAAATFADAVTAHLIDLRGRIKTGKRSSATERWYNTKIGHWRRILGDAFRLAGLDVATTTRVTQQRREEGASEATIGAELVALSSTLKSAIGVGLWQGDPRALRPAGVVREYVPRSRWAPIEEVQRLLGELDAEDGARVAFIVATGARASEADRAERQDVATRPEGGFYVRLRGTKTAAAARTVAVILPEHQALLAWALEHAVEAGGRLFRAYDPHRGNHRRTRLRACARAGIAPLSENDLRRSHATHLRRAGVPDAALAADLGHTTTTMVQRVYARLDATAVGEAMARALGGTEQPRFSGTHLQQTPAHSVDTMDAADAISPGKDGGSSGDRTLDLRIKSPAVPSPAILLPTPKKPHINTRRRVASGTHLQHPRASR